MKNKKVITLLIPAFFILCVLGYFFLFNNPEEISAQKGEAIPIAEEGVELSSEIDDEVLSQLQEKYKVPTLVVGDVSGAPGNELSTSLYIINNPGLLGLSGYLSYDRDSMEIISVENGRISENVLNLTTPEDFNESNRFLWDGIELSEEDIQDGEILKINFKIKSSSETGKYPVRFIPDQNGAVDNDLEVIELSFETGYLTVLES